MMLNKLFNLVPPKVIRYIGNKSFASLQERGEIKTWMVGYTQNSSLLDSRETKDEDGDGDDDDSDDDDGDFDSLFDFDIKSLGVEDGECDPDVSYIDRHIARIPQHGDDSRWRLADCLNMFEHLNPNGTLTNEQRQAVDNFVVGYQSVSSESE